MTSGLVFAEWQRTDARPAHHGEPLSTFLDRVAQPLFARVRDLINDWVGELASDSQADVVARLRSPIDPVFRAAFWELYVYVLLRRCGFGVTVHPAVRDTAKVPDFEAVRDALRFYVEASAVGTPEDDQSTDARRGRVYDELNETRSPDFFLWVDINADGPTDVSMKPLRAELEAWLQTLDADQVLDEIASSGAADRTPRLNWEQDGWRLSIGAYPKSPSARDTEEMRPVGIYGSAEAQMIDDRAPLLRRMKRKANRYGALDAPFVLAISGSTFTTDEQDLISALFGSEQITVLTPNGGGDPIVRPSRADDGLWIRHGQPKHAQVSGVLFVPFIEPWEVAHKVPVLVRHPVADLPLDLECPHLRTCRVDDSGGLAWTGPSEPIHQLLGLPPDWPGPEDAFVPGSY